MGGHQGKAERPFPDEFRGRRALQFVWASPDRPVLGGGERAQGCGRERRRHPRAQRGGVSALQGRNEGRLLFLQGQRGQQPSSQGASGDRRPGRRDGGDHQESAQSGAAIGLCPRGIGRLCWQGHGRCGDRAFEKGPAATDSALRVQGAPWVWAGLGRFARHVRGGRSALGSPRGREASDQSISCSLAQHVARAAPLAKRPRRQPQHLYDARARGRVTRSNRPSCTPQQLVPRDEAVQVSSTVKNVAQPLCTSELLETGIAVASTPQMNSEVVKIRGLNKWYGRGKARNHVLKGVSLDIRKGEIVSINGTSGSGKTTLLNIIGGLDRVFEGKVEVDGRDLLALSDRKLSHLRNETMGFVFQAFNLLPHITCVENVMVPAYFSSRGMSKAHQRAEALLEMVGLSDKTNEHPTELSGGQRQRVSIARALFNRPSIILCDEPTGSLDQGTGRQILSLFHTLNEDDGITIILVTHDNSVSDRCSRVIRIEDGVIKSDKTQELRRFDPGEVESHPDLT
ncbi:MAG: hypothetical protein CO108_16380 [Deltaproteobacteria bacterium CG_4_9_14_3_um_filter_63_12]|nr:MAG: hypothetical protein CO108_16380 [Deltaproteobacteria bacterium CG_4_9_14_3_um_filter_63_12]